MARAKTKQPPLLHQPVIQLKTTRNGGNSLKIKIDHLSVIEPLTVNQKVFFDVYQEQNNFIGLLGYAGTGKTFVAMYKALEEVLDPSNSFERIIIVRSAVQGRDLGHTPGSVEEKMSLYEMPYIQICENLFGRGDAYSRLCEQGHVKFMSTSFLRGATFDNSIVIVDEMQNMNWGEISTVMTRVGEDSKIIWCGDYRQVDLNKSNDKSGIYKFMEVTSHMRSFRKIEFIVDDIVRSSLVRDWIIACDKAGV